MRTALLCLLLSLLSLSVHAQDEGFTAIHAEVDFGKKLRPWDGFGVNYVETSQTFDHATNPQDYGGFRFLKEKDRQAIVDLVFGDDGLRPGLVKMFLDPLHQRQAGGAYDHTTTTGSMRTFVREGLRHMRRRGDSLAIITTLYGPPGYITRQKMIRGRDLDPAHEADLVAYLVDWARFLRRKEGFPLAFISLHNEGEDWARWPRDGTLGETERAGHDYNFFWPPEQVNRMLRRVRAGLDAAGLQQVGVTNGEPTNWYRFPAWGYADALAGDPAALKALGLITSHGFYVGSQQSGRWFGPHTSRGIDQIREKRPDLHAWTTSTAWDEKEDSAGVRQYVMDAGFVKEIHGAIYEAKLNGLIPWAFIQNASQWNKPDPNPGCAIRVYDDGTWEIQKGYYYFKQVSRAGQPGMSVAHTSAMESEIALIGFASNGTKHPDAVVVTNFTSGNRKLALHIRGTGAKSFRAYRTTGRQVYQPRNSAQPLNDDTDNYKDLGSVRLEDGVLRFDLPRNSVVTFFAE